MRSTARLWTAYGLARSARTRPSEIYGIDHPVQAFCFDRAVMTFGNALQAELDGADGKNKKEIESKRQRILQRWIPEASAGFADPAKRMGQLR